VRVLLTVVHFAKGGIALVIERTVWLLVLAQEIPDLAIVPIKYWENTHKFGPSWTALAYGL
jgi:hypothetical protein